MTEQEKSGWFSRLRAGLTKTSSKISDGITGIFTKRKLDAAMLEELEEVLISADVGATTAAQLVRDFGRDRFDKELGAEEVKNILATQIAAILAPVAVKLLVPPSQPSPARGEGVTPHVILMVGVNGTGKTTTIGKLAKQMKDAGQQVVLAAADTFRAAAVEQLKVWGARNDCPVIAAAENADPASVAYQALEQARAAKANVLLVDSAGRLQNKSNLMAELQKIIKVMKKLDDTAPHQVILVLDATTGQNALSQVKIFRDLVNITGLVVTKLDGTARGGIILALAREFGLPIHAVGVGEGIEDLRDFNPDDFARNLVGLG